jgi:hypothetical protein
MAVRFIAAYIASGLRVGTRSFISAAVPAACAAAGRIAKDLGTGFDRAALSTPRRSPNRAASYNCNRGAADIVASGDLPPDILILQEGDCSGRPDEGQAMMELIHDVAPGANHLFYAPFGQADFAQAIIKLADAGC